MSPDMEKVAIELIGKLEKQLGVASSEIWNTLLLQAKISGIQHLIVALIITFIAGIVFFLFWKEYKDIEEEQNEKKTLRNSTNRHNADLINFIYGSKRENKYFLPICIALPLWLMIFIPTILSAITRFLNPNMWAIERLFILIK